MIGDVVIAKSKGDLLALTDGEFLGVVEQLFLDAGDGDVRRIALRCSSFFKPCSSHLHVQRVETCAGGYV